MPEFEDAAFGPRASAVHTRLQAELLSSAGSASYVLSAIPVQMEVVAMLRHINSELKVDSPLLFGSRKCRLETGARLTAVPSFHSAVRIGAGLKR